MKVKNILLLTTLTSSMLLSQSPSGKELFNNFCAGCHHSIVGVNESGGKITNIYEAPYAKDVIDKLKIETKTKEKFIAFVEDYIDEPNKRKSLYSKRAIKNFGLMPSLKGVMSDKEKSLLAQYLYSDYDKETIEKSIKTTVPSIDNKNKVLFSKHCASCHTTIIGVDESGGNTKNLYNAPYAKDIFIKLRTHTKDKEEFVTFIKDYIEAPDKRKSIYGKKAIKNFGLMPSLKGAMTDSEVTGLTNYIYEKYTN